jgi:hypothetical protein
LCVCVCVVCVCVCVLRDVFMLQKGFEFS